MAICTVPLCALLVAPRPVARHVMPSRAKLEAVCDALESLDDRMLTEWLWPPTVEALAARLRDQSRPAVGALYLDVAAVDAGTERGLCFESDSGALVLCDLSKLGEALRGPSPRVVVLGTVGGSLSWAEGLAMASAQPVVDLSETLSPEQVGRGMRALFAALLAGRSLVKAVDDARLGLGKHKLVPTRDELQAVTLFSEGCEDDAPKPSRRASRVRSSAKSTKSPALLTPTAGSASEPGRSFASGWRQITAPYEIGSLPPRPTEAFFGRAQELAALERALRADQGNGLVLLHGPEAIGKTTLLAHAARWLVRTGRFAQVVYSDFSGGGYADLALQDLGQRLLGGGFVLGEDSERAIGQTLVAVPTLVIWDGMQSLLPGHEWALDAQSLCTLLQLGARLARSGASRLCVVTEGPILPNPLYGEAGGARLVELGGMAEHDALDLLLSKRDQADSEGPSWVRDEARMVVNVAGGNPLALCILPALLKGRTPAQVVANLEDVREKMRETQGMPQASEPACTVQDSGPARQAPDLASDRFEVTLETTLKTLDGDFDRALNSLGCFAGPFLGSMAISICGLTEEMWRVARKRLISYSLMREDPLPGMDESLVCCSPSLRRRMGNRLASERRQTLNRLYRSGYVTLANWAIKNEQRAPTEVRTLARYELPNMRRALSLLLESDDLDVASDHADALDQILAMLGLAYEREATHRRVQQTLREATSEASPLGRGGVRALTKQGETLLAQGHISEAVAVLEGLVARMAAEGALDYGRDQVTLDHGIALHRLGCGLRAIQDLDAAISAYGSAISALNSIDRGEATLRELVAVYRDLGETQMATDRLDLAENAYREGLALATELGEPRDLGAMCNRLGAVLIARGDCVEATTHSGAAIIHCRMADDAMGEATAWDQVGTCAWRAGDAAHAEHCLQKAQELAEKAENPSLQARLLTRLGSLTEEAGRMVDAVAWYKRLVQLASEKGMGGDRLAGEMSLAEVALSQGRLQEAKTHAGAAREAAEGLGVTAKPWKAYALLREIAAEEGDDEGVARWSTSAVDSYASSAEAEQTLANWGPFIEDVAAAHSLDALRSENVEVLRNLEATEDLAELAASIGRILRGERGPELWVHLDLVGALLVRSILQARHGDGS